MARTAVVARDVQTAAEDRHIQDARRPFSVFMLPSRSDDSRFKR